jgi:hypothetical protein
MAAGQIVLDTYPHQVTQWCWRPEWYVQGESAATLFWKFARLNQLTAREVAMLVTNRTSGQRGKICKKPDVDLRDASVFDLEQLARMFRVPAARIGRAFLYEILPGSVLRSHGHFRWCAQCLNHGFHTPLFQMRLTHTCPVHEQPLHDSCPVCHRQILYRLNSLFLLKPFCCPNCEADLAAAMTKERPNLLRMRPEQAASLSLLLKFYRAADVDLVGVNDSQQLFASARNAGIIHVGAEEIGVQCRYASFIAQVIQDVAPVQYKQQSGLRFESIVRHECGCWRPITEDDDEECIGAHSTSDDADHLTESQECLAALIETYKAVRRRLWRRFLASHQRCVDSAAKRMWQRMEGARTGAFCPPALAFIRWRMLWEACGTPRYLLTRPAKDYYGIIGWHLARPLQVPVHWSRPTKIWVMSHIFASTCLAAFDELLRWAEMASNKDDVVWTRPKSPIDYTCLWAVAGRDCSDRPTNVYLRRSRVACDSALVAEHLAAHWQRHLVAIAHLQR